MFVISRNTAFTYRHKPIDTKQIGRELGVRYVLEGSVRRSGSRVRVNAQLIDAETDAHLWAERFDGDTGDLFALQDEVTSRIAISLNLELIAAEAARPTQNPDALDFILRGRAVLLRPASGDSLDAAVGLFQRALALDHDSAEAQCLLANVLVRRRLDFGSDSPDADIEQAEALSLRTLAATPRSPLAHFARGQVLRSQGRLDEAISEYETVLASDRNWVEALAAIGRCKILIGPIHEAIPAHEQAIRLSPRDPSIGTWCFRIGLVHLLQSRTDEAIVWLKKARNAIPAHPNPRAALASAYALKGDTQRAAAELAEAQRLSPDGRFSSLGRLKAALGYWGVPKIRALFEATLFVGLRKAGMPDD